MNMEFGPLRPVRVSIPAKVANNLELFEKSFGTLMERLGCPACCSGFDISFIQQRNYLIEQRPSLVKREALQKGIASISPRAAYNLDGVLENVRQIVDELGCPACCSGFDITFRQEFDVLFNDNLDIQLGSEIRGF